MKIFKLILMLCFPLLLVLSSAAQAGKISLSLQFIDIREVMLMLSREQRLNIFVTEGVSGNVSVNLYDMDTIDAIYSIAESAGFVVEERNGSYFIINRDEAGKFYQSGLTEVRSLKVQYSSLSEVEAILKDHLSSYGSIKSISENNLLVVEDIPDFLDKIEYLLGEIDREPKQIMIEAKILEIALTDNQSYGLDWGKLFNSSSATGRLGTQGLSSSSAPGLFAQYANSNVDLVLSALKERGRLRTISTPKLLAMEGREAETVVGTRIGFRVTTTVNQVTTESVEFLESGIILKVTPTVDRRGRIMLDIHPEVSAGSVSDDGIPSKTTTQVSTRMLVPNGRTVFMGGLIKHSTADSREGVPGLGDLPIIGGLFSNESKNLTSSEIVVLITPRIIDYESPDFQDSAVDKVQSMDELIESQLGAASDNLNTSFDGKKPVGDVEMGDRR